jgi:TetR/AcrR family transcriptional regulator, repressor for neighboring sulfatase
MNSLAHSARRGPRRREGAPAGPVEVRTAVLEAAASLFAMRGIDGVSLRDIATEADVNLTLIRRYVGSRDDLISAVFAHVSEQLAESVAQNPLAGQGHSPDTVMGTWVRIGAALAISRRPMPADAMHNPVQAIADSIAAGYGLSPEAARVRAAQIVATALGWRIFEGYLIEAAGLDEIPVEVLREELVHAGRRTGATPWPSPPDPPTVPR